MTTIMVTGLTGTVVSEICTRLLADGHTIVALVRQGKGDPGERVSRVLDIDEQARSRVKVLPGDITREFGGLSPAQRSLWRGNIGKLLHGAASIDLGTTNKDQIIQTNVGGTQNLVRLAETLDIPEFHYLSTAYVAGAPRKVTEGDSPETQEHRNPYEYSKAQSGRLVWDFSGKFAIYRIPVVVGNSKTGVIGRFSGYYGFLEPFWRLSCALSGRWEQSPGTLLDQGIRRDEEGYFHVPIAVPCSEIGRINLVPIDWLCDMFARLLVLPADQGVFHITHPSPPRVKHTIRESLEHLGIRGVLCGSRHSETHSGSALLMRIQRRILKSIKPFEPYISKDGEWFSNTRAARTLGEAWRDPPVIDPVMIGVLLEYARSKNFGR